MVMKGREGFQPPSHASSSRFIRSISPLSSLYHTSCLTPSLPATCEATCRRHHQELTPYTWATHPRRRHRLRSRLLRDDIEQMPVLRTRECRAVLIHFPEQLDIETIDQCSGLLNGVKCHVWATCPG